MNFDQAIVAHGRWKAKLSAYIKKPDRSLSASEVMPDNQCELGQWIHGDGAKYAALPEFQTLRSEHARFHKAAAEIIRKADSGKDVSEEVSSGSKSEFSTATVAVVDALAALKVAAAKEVVVTK
jgi:Chemoreceptor zinc-binding domain